MMNDYDYLKFKSNKIIADELDKYEKIIFSDAMNKYDGSLMKECILMITNKYFYITQDSGIFMILLEITQKVSFFNIAAITILSNAQFEFIIHIPSEYDSHFRSTKYSS